MDVKTAIREIAVLVIGGAACGFVNTLPIDEPFRRPAVVGVGIVVLLMVARDLGLV